MSTPSPPYCRLDLAPPLADQFIFGVAPIDYGPVLLLMPFGFHLTMNTLPSEGLLLRPTTSLPPSLDMAPLIRAPEGLQPSRTTRCSAHTTGLSVTPCGPACLSRDAPVDRIRDHRWGFPCCYWSTLPACRRHYPGRSDGTRSLVLSINGGPPTKHGGRAPALIVSRPAQRSLHVTACMLAKSPKRPSTPEAPTASFPPPPLRLLPGGANPVPGRDFHPQSTSAFSRRTRYGDFSPVNAAATL